MSENIPALIARLEKLLDVTGYAPWKDDVIPLLDALSAAASPGDDEREALKTALTDGYWQRTGHRVTWEHLGPLMDAILASGFRRPSPVTREAPTSGVYIHGPLGEALRPALPEPAEVEWEYTLMQGDTTDEIFDSMSDLADYYGIRFHEGEYPVRRVKAGPWVPVKGTEQ